jgi:hypothetical protein
MLVPWIGWATWRGDLGRPATDKGAAGWPLRRRLLFAVAAGRVLGAVELVREVLGKVSALIMWGTALYLARQLWEAAA